MLHMSAGQERYFNGSFQSVHQTVRSRPMSIHILRRCHSEVMRALETVKTAAQNDWRVNPLIQTLQVQDSFYFLIRVFVPSLCV
jgi:hypothetical protein